MKDGRLFLVYGKTHPVHQRIQVFQDFPAIVIIPHQYKIISIADYTDVCFGKFAVGVAYYTVKCV